MNLRQPGRIVEETDSSPGGDPRPVGIENRRLGSGVRGCGIVVTLLACLGGAAAAAQSTSTLTADDFFARGVQFHQSGDILGAIEAYEAALLKEPGRIDARSNLGAAYVRLGRYEDAVREYRRALEADPQQPAVRFNLALALYKASLVPEAAVELEQVVALDPKNTAALLLLADCELQRGNDARVVELLEPREADLVDDRLYCYLLGNALLRRQEFARGQALIDRLFRGGDTAPARLLMGVAHLRRQDGGSALPELERAAQLDPKLPTVHSLYGRALMETGRRQEAGEAFRRELQNNPNDFDSNLYRGLLLRDEGQLDEAFDHLKRAGRLRAQDPRVLYALGSLHLAAGRIPEAEKSLEAVTAAVPDYMQAHVLLATVYYRQKKKDLGDRERDIVERLRRERQAREPGASDELGPAYKGEELPPDPSAASTKDKDPKGKGDKGR
jgi:tetratricopeptide (TPR) repeat protein